MRAVVQRVDRAKVLVNRNIVGQINKGLFILLALSEKDDEERLARFADKIIKLRIIADENGKMNLSAIDTKLQILVVSQFTLYADTTKGNRPSFIKAASPQLAERLYDHFVSYLKEKGLEIATGSFGQYMQIEAKLDGPVTIILEE